jgi:hypothetical protein
MSTDVFRPLGDPIERQLVGKWRWKTAARTIKFDLKYDGSFTATDKPNVRPPLGEGAGLADEGKGTWKIEDGNLSIVMTHVWAVAFWKEHQVNWIVADRVVQITESQVQLEHAEPLTRL